MQVSLNGQQYDDTGVSFRFHEYCSGRVTLTEPEGAFYAFVECKGLIGKRTGKGTVLSNDAEVAEYLLEAAGVATVPGAAFGLSPCFRLSFAAARPLLASACSRIADAVTTLEDGR